MNAYPNPLPGRYLRHIGASLLNAPAQATEISYSDAAVDAEASQLQAAVFTSVDALGTDWAAGLAKLLDRCAADARVVLTLPNPSHARRFGKEPDPCWLNPDLFSTAAAALGFHCVRWQVTGFLVADALGNQGLAQSGVIKPNAWRRLLSWLDEDEALFELACLLHAQLFTRLDPALSERQMVLLHRVPAGSSASLAALPTQTLIGQIKGDSALQARLDGLLEAPRCRVLLYLLWSAAWSSGGAAALLDALPSHWREMLLNWQDAYEADRRCLDLARGWRRLPGVAEILDQGELEAGACTDYRLLISLLAQRHNLFIGRSA